jgi:outer membrane protein assembly factor BamB
MRSPSLFALIVRASFASVFAISLAPAIGASGQEWPEFRGPSGQGHAPDAKNLPVDVGDPQNVAWKTSIPGKGWSSPVIGGNEIWMTYGVDVPATEEQKRERLASNTGNQPLVVSARVGLHAICVSRTDGKVLADVELFAVDNPQPVHDMNSFASCTPVLKGDRLYCSFGTYGTCCLDTKSRKVVWLNQEVQIKHENGPGSHPVLFEDRLLVHFDGSDTQSLVAFDVEDGSIAWKTPRSGEMHNDPQEKKAYGTPLVIEQDGRPVAVSPAADWVYGYDPRSGDEVWRVSYGDLGYSTVPRPVAGHGMVYVCTSFNRSILLAIRYEGVAKPEVVWKFDRQVSQKPSPLLVGDEIYVVSDKGGVLTCLDAHTGEERYAERLGGNFSASPLFADGKIYLGNHEGEVFVVAPGPKFELLSQSSLDGQIMASPAAVGEELYFRTAASLYRLQKAKP